MCALTFTHSIVEGEDHSLSSASHFVSLLVLGSEPDRSGERSIGLAEIDRYVPH